MHRSVFVSSKQYVHRYGVHINQNKEGNQNMKKFKWDEEKNKLLKKERGVSFEEILNSTFLGAEKHQTRKNQIVLLFLLQ